MTTTADRFAVLKDQGFDVLRTAIEAALSEPHLSFFQNKEEEIKESYIEFLRTAFERFQPTDRLWNLIALDIYRDVAEETATFALTTHIGGVMDFETIGTEEDDLLDKVRTIVANAAHNIKPALGIHG